jgi:hypothetical protein
MSNIFFLHLFGETKVSNFTNAIVEQNVCEFEISVHGPNLMKAFEAIQDLFEEVSGLIFC